MRDPHMHIIIHSTQILLHYNEVRTKAEHSAIFIANEVNDQLRVMPHTMRSTPRRIV